MPLRINLNKDALFAQTNLGIVQGKLTQALERLSSGLRINHAWEDPAGLLFSLQMQFQIVGVDAGNVNLSMAVDAMNTSDSFTRTIGDNLTRMTDLSFQAKNALLTTEQRSTLNFEFMELLEEVNRMAQNAEYNGKVLLNGSLLGVTVQTGYSAGNVVTLSIPCLTIGGSGLNISAMSIGGGMTYAQSAINQINSSVQTIFGPAIAAIGAQSAGWSRSVSAQEMYSANLKAARSRIIDADLAQETTNLTNAQVIVQSGIGALAQANAAQTLALGLLG